MNREIKTSIKKISEYWIKNNNICETVLNFDWIDSNTNCWNCGDNKETSKGVKLERCHIIPHSLGGLDVASNYVLLCKDCHKEAPNISNKNDIWDWIKSNYIPFSVYDTYKIRKALVIFKQKEGFSFFSKAIKINNLQEVLINEFKTISNHGFDKINEITYYYYFKNIIQSNK
jgi:hypothetical protein